MVNSQRLLLSTSKILLLLALVIVVPVGVTAQVWIVLAVDPKGDGRDPSLADAAQLSLDDQPEMADDAIAAFTHRIANR